MGIEIEAKMPLKDPAALENRLRKLGAKAGRSIIEINTFFDTPQAALRSGDQGLRLRVEHEIDGKSHIVTLTHKGPRAHGRVKTRSETEVIVDNANHAAQLLTALGFLPVFMFEKKRKHWQMDKCIIALDTLPHLGDFVEIEGPSESDVMAARDKLGLGNLPLLQASYISMLLTYLAEHHLTTDRVSFNGHGTCTSKSDTNAK